MVPEVLPRPPLRGRAELTGVERSGGSGESPAGEECTLELDAVIEGTTHVSGIGWRLATARGPGEVRAETRRYGRTLVFSELAALRRGLAEAREANCRRVKVVSPSDRLGPLVVGAPTDRWRRARAAAERLSPLVRGFEEVVFERSTTPDAELHHAVGEALDAGLHAAAERAEHRVRVMEQIVARAADVRLERRDGEWVANDRYRVRLAPMSCECPAWSARWSRVSVAARRAQRLPCKHLVALAIREGIRVPADLAELARRAPP